MNTGMMGAREEKLAALAGSGRVFVVVLPLARTLLWCLAAAAVAGAGLAGYRVAAGPEALERLFVHDAPVETGMAIVDLPELVVNLRAETPSRYLKIALTLAVPAAERLRVEQAAPRLVDALQGFLRNLDQHDLEGSAGLHRLRTEIGRRFNLMLAEPGSGREVVTDVLLRSLLTQ